MEDISHNIKFNVHNLIFWLIKKHRLNHYRKGENFKTGHCNILNFTFNKIF